MQVNILNNISKWLFLAMVPLLIVTYVSVIIEPVLMPRSVLLSFMLLLIILLGFSKINLLNVVKTNTWWWLAFCAYVLLSILSISWATCVSDGILEANRIILMALVSLVAIAQFNYNKTIIRLLPKGILLASAMLIVWGGWEMLGSIGNLGKDAMKSYSIKASMGNRNLYGSSLLLILPFLGYTFFVSSRLWKLAAFVQIALATLILLMLHNRSAWVSLIIMIMAGVFYSIRMLSFDKPTLLAYWQKNKYYFFILVVVFITSLSVFGFSKPKAFSYLMRRMYSIVYDTQIKEHNNDTVNERYSLWNHTINLIKENPIKGVGIGSWKLNYPKYGFDNLRGADGFVIFQRPHNDYLWVMSETGIAGGISYILIFIIPIYLSFIRLPEIDDKEDRLLVIAAGISVIGFACIAFFSFPKERVFHNTMLFLSICIILFLTKKSAQTVSSNVNKRHSKLIVIVLVTLCVWVGATSILRLKGEFHTIELQKAYSQVLPVQMLEQANMASSFFYQMDPFASPISWYKGTAYYLQEDFKNARNEYEKGLKINPYHLHLINNMGSTQEKLGRSDSAIYFYKRVLAFSPKYEESLLNLSAVYFNQGNVNEAYSTIQQCPIESENPRYQFYLYTILKAVLQSVIPDSTMQSQGFEIFISDAPRLTALYKNARQNDSSFFDAALKEINGRKTD